ncbi:hypothetical protein WDV93_13805 [Pantoea ananatis]
MPVSVIKYAVKTAALAAIVLAGLQGVSFANDLPSRTTLESIQLKKCPLKKANASTNESATKLAAWHHHLEINPGCNDPLQVLVAPTMTMHNA